jgi:hypothetical protein
MIRDVISVSEAARVPAIAAESAALGKTEERPGHQRS